MKFGLEEQVIENIVSVLEQHPKVDKAFVFGSRAKGNYRPDSDIDIAIKGYEITTDDIIAISVDIETIGVTYKFDLIDYNSIKEPALKEHIDRVGIEFYSRWKEMTLRDAGCDFLSGYAFKSSDYSNMGIPLIKIGNIQNRNVTIDTDGDFVLENIINEKVSKYILSKNDVLIAMTGQGSVGRVGKLKIKEGERALLNQRVGKFICNEIDLNINYLYYVLTSDKYQDLLFNNGSGSGQPNLSPELILATEIPWVNYKEQTAIASILSSLDDKIDLLHRQNKTLEQLAETLFRQWFVEEAEESWEKKSLTEIADYLNGLALQKFPAKIDCLPVIKIREMKQGISENTDKCSREIPKQYIIQDGDILFSWSGSLELVLWTGGEGALNQHLFKVTSKVYPKWFYYLATKHHLNDFRTIAESKSTTMGHIQREHLNQAMIAIPSKEIFKQYDERISPIIEKQIKNSKQIHTLIQTRDTLLPKLMSGEIRVRI